MATPIKFVGNDRLKEIFGYIKDVLPKKATDTELGLVKPDGTTITVDANGVISSKGGGSGASDWSDLENKPFESIDENTLGVDEDGVLSVIGGVGASSWEEVSDKPFESLDENTFEVKDGVLAISNIEVPIATSEAVGVVKPDDYTTEVDDNGAIKVQSGIFATSQEVDEVSSEIPTLVPYTEEELFSIVWEQLSFEEKPEYTTEDLDAILDTIDFSGGGGGSGAKEMTIETMNQIWDEVFK